MPGTVSACKSKKIGGYFVHLPPHLAQLFMKHPLLLLLLLLLLPAACRRGPDDLALLRRADALWQTDADSTAALLAQVERPELLPREELLRYGWLRAYVHQEDNASMSEDSLVLPAFD